MNIHAIYNIIDHPQFLQWTAVCSVFALGVILLVYDIRERQAKLSEKTHVKLRVEAVSSTIDLHSLS